MKPTIFFAMVLLLRVQAAANCSLLAAFGPNHKNTNNRFGPTLAVAAATA
jgi:hypothetical protein